MFVCPAHATAPCSTPPPPTHTHTTHTQSLLSLTHTCVADVEEAARLAALAVHSQRVAHGSLRALQRYQRAWA
jgi:hypothetical protein